MTPGTLAVSGSGIAGTWARHGARHGEGSHPPGRRRECAVHLCRADDDGSLAGAGSIRPGRGAATLRGTRTRTGPGTYGANTKVAFFSHGIYLYVMLTHILK